MEIPDDEGEVEELRFTVKYPKGYKFGREYIDILKDIPLMLWGNAIGFTEPEESYIDFEVSDERLEFFKWIGEQNAYLDGYYSGKTDPSWTAPRVQTGSDTGALLTPELPDQSYQGTLISQSTGKESISSLHVAREVDERPIHSMFIGYPSRAATHKQESREKFKEHFDHPVHGVWGNFNYLQSRLEQHTENYDPCVQFWEMFYVTAALPLAVHHGLRWILLGNEINAGRKIQLDNGKYAVEELNQSWVFEHEYSEYVKYHHGLPIKLTSVIQPMTDFGCRKVMYREFPDFLHAVESCLRPTAAHGKWCEKCYKCAATWVESVALGVDPETFGMSHDILFKSPHLGGEGEDWGYEFAKPNRDEAIWEDYDAIEKLPNLSEEQLDGLKTWRERQEERTSEEEMEEYRKYYDRWSEPMAEVVPGPLRYNPDLEPTLGGPEGYLP